MEFCGPVVKTIDLSKEEKIEPQQKTKSDAIPETVSKKPTIVEPQVVTTKRKEVSKPRYSSSLSRTPSPFLKPHEREKAQKGTATAPQKKVGIDKKTDVASKPNNRESDTSSSESSESDDSEEEENNKTASRKKKVQQRSRKAKNSSDSDNDSDGDISDNEKVSSKGKNAFRRESGGDISNVEAIGKHKPHSGNKEQLESSSKKSKVAQLVSSEQGSVVQLPSSETKKSTVAVERRKSESSAESEDGRKSKQIGTASRKRTLSVTGLKKQQRDSSDSDSDQVVKKKRKKNKKTSKKNSDDSSDSENETKKKKHKKHKKHSKKSKKHKKHKKKSKKADTTSSSEDEPNERVVKNPTIGRMIGGVNEDLEKQLRERALKSMKKLD